MLQKGGRSCFYISRGGDGGLFPSLPFLLPPCDPGSEGKDFLLLSTSSCVSWGRAGWGEPGGTPHVLSQGLYLQGQAHRQE